MKTELIQTKDYLLLVEKVYGFKVGDWNYEEDNTIPVYQFDYNIDEYPSNKIIAYYPLTKEAEELDLPLLPNPFAEASTKELAKQFSLEDMRNMFILGGKHKMQNPDSFLIKMEEILQSLSAQQLPKEFTPEIIKSVRYKYLDNSHEKRFTFKGLIPGDILIANETQRGLGGDFIPYNMDLIEKSKEYMIKKISSFGLYTVPWIIDEDCNHDIPDFDLFTVKNEGCIRTITNSEGKLEVVGTYS